MFYRFYRFNMEGKGLSGRMGARERVDETDYLSSGDPHRRWWAATGYILTQSVFMSFEIRFLYLVLIYFIIR